MGGVLGPCSPPRACGPRLPRPGVSRSGGGVALTSRMGGVSESGAVLGPRGGRRLPSRLPGGCQVWLSRVREAGLGRGDVWSPSRLAAQG